MRAIPLSVMKGGINRLRVKGGASPVTLYDLTNAYISNAGTIVPREGTIRAQTLNNSTVGLCCVDGTFYVFATSLISVPSGYQCIILAHPTDSAATLAKIWFAKPFMGFLYVTAQFNTGDIFDYWLQDNGTWTADTVYMTGNIVLPTTATGYAYQAVRDMQTNSTWQSEVAITLGTIVEPNDYTGYVYKAVAVAGTTPHTGSTEPTWPTTAGAVLQEFGDFDTNTNDSGTTTGSTTTSSSSTAQPLGSNITDRYGDSSTIAGQTGTTASSSSLTVSASTAVATWAPGTTYAPGAVVQPSTSQGAYIDAIPNGDFESGNDGNWVLGSGSSIIDNPSVAYQGDYCAKLQPNNSQTQVTMYNYGTVTAGQSVSASAYINPNNGGSALDMSLKLFWYDSSDTLISSVDSGGVTGSGWRKVTVTGTAPTNAAHVRVSIHAATGTNPQPGYADLVTWTLEQPTTVSNFLYEAVQAAAASSGSTEPAWPTTAGDEVADGGVTWKAIGTSIITWQAIPIMLSGGAGIVATYTNLIGGSLYTNGTYDNVALTGGHGSGATANIVISGGAVTSVTLVSGGAAYQIGDTLSCANSSVGGTGSGFSITVDTLSGTGGEPTWPTTVGITVNDPSTYTDLNGDVIDTSMSWQCIARQITDSNCPNTIPTCLGASHVFAGNEDICSYSAAVDPTDWTSSNNAGYLPTGLNNYGDNPVAMLALYRSNLMVFNAGGYQMWQIDPDPANMALLDAQPVGSTYPRAAQSVANNLLILTEVGVRDIGTVGATANMQVGQLGQPVDPLVLAQLRAGTYDPLSLYYPGRGQYWLFFGPQAFVLTINGTGLKTWSRYIFPDTITDWTLDGGVLYMRTAGNLVWQLDYETLQDDVHTTTGTPFTSTIQWPYLDGGSLGINKMLEGVDLVGVGECTIQIGYQQADATTFSDNAGFSTSQNVTAPYIVDIVDTVPGTPIPIPINAPSYTLILTFNSNQPGLEAANSPSWEWDAANLYVTDAGGAGATG